MDFPQAKEEKKKRKPREAAAPAAMPPALLPGDIPPVPAEKRDDKKPIARVLLDDLKDVYYELGGKKFVEDHVRSRPSYKQKFLDNMSKLAAKAIESDVKINVSGRVEHEHIQRFGFTPEIVVSAINEMQAGAGIHFSLDSLLSLPIPTDDMIGLSNDLVPVEKLEEK